MSTQVNRKRYIGLDLLRLIAMFGIVMLHTLSRSGLLKSTVISQYRIAWLLEIIFYFAVDSFGIITGFVSYSEEDKPTNIKNFINLWLEVSFYGIISFFIFRFFMSQPLTKFDLLKVSLPVTFNQYWYFTAYAGVVLVSRMLNRGIRNSNNKQLLKDIVLILLVCSLYESFTTLTYSSDKSIINSLKGYSFIWLAVLYYVGAAMRKTKLFEKIDTKKSILTILLCVLFSFIWFILIGPKLEAMGLGKGIARVFVSYTSPTIVIIAILLVSIFSKYEFKNFESISKFVAPRAFSIYLLNSQGYIAKWFWNNDLLNFLLKYNNVKLIVLLIVLCVLFVLGTLAIDSIRIILFKSLKIQAVSQFIANSIVSLQNRIEAFIKNMIKSGGQDE